MGSIRVGDFFSGLEGNTHVLEAAQGFGGIDVIGNHGLPIAALCGGAWARATCQVRVAAVWAAGLSAVREDEEEMLDGVPEAEPTSRLASRSLWHTPLAGMDVALVGGEA